MVPNADARAAVAVAEVNHARTVIRPVRIDAGFTEHDALILQINYVDDA
jgi:hypothetical protein